MNNRKKNIGYRLKKALPWIDAIHYAILNKDDSKFDHALSQLSELNLVSEANFFLHQSNFSFRQISNLSLVGKCCKLNRTLYLEKLLAAGADAGVPEPNTKKFCSPLLFAISHENIAILRSLLHVDPELIKKDKKNVLLFSAFNRQYYSESACTEIFSELIAAAAPHQLNQTDQDGNNVLHLAFNHKMWSVCKSLLKHHSININHVSNLNHRPLNLAIITFLEQENSNDDLNSHQTLEIIKLLIQRGAYMTNVFAHLAFSALYIKYKKNQNDDSILELFKQFMLTTSNHQLVQKFILFSYLEQDPLVFTRIDHNDFRICFSLINYLFSRLDLKNCPKKTLEDCLVENIRADMIDSPHFKPLVASLLLNAGVSPNAITQIRMPDAKTQSISLLCWAVFNRNEPIVKLLLQKNADFTLRHEMISPFFYAIRDVNLPLLELFFKKIPSRQHLNQISDIKNGIVIQHLILESNPTFWIPQGLFSDEVYARFCQIRMVHKKHKNICPITGNLKNSSVVIEVDDKQYSVKLNYELKIKLKTHSEERLLLYTYENLLIALLYKENGLHEQSDTNHVAKKKNNAPICLTPYLAIDESRFTPSASLKKGEK